MDNFICKYMSKVYAIWLNMNGWKLRADIKYTHQIRPYSFVKALMVSIVQSTIQTGCHLFLCIYFFFLSYYASSLAGSFCYCYISIRIYAMNSWRLLSLHIFIFYFFYFFRFSVQSHSAAIRRRQLNKYCLR